MQHTLSKRLLMSKDGQNRDTSDRYMQRLANFFFSFLNVPEGSRCSCLRPPPELLRRVCSAACSGLGDGGIHTRSRLGQPGLASAYCPNPVAFRPPTLIVITFPARPFLPHPRLSVTSYVRVTNAGDLSPPERHRPLCLLV